jgi:N-acetylated-alpha-linked acidic dipeptidase
LNATDYALGLGTYLDHIKPAADNLPEKAHFEFAPLDRAILEFQESAKAFDAYADGLASQLGENVPWYHWWKKVRLWFQIRATNAKYKGIERAFLYQPGLDGREWFKHVVFAPGIWTGYSGATYPGIVESLEAGDVENANVSHQIPRARALTPYIC